MTKAVAMYIIYTLLRIKKSPKLSIRMVDIMSINYHLTNNQRSNNLGWEAKINMEEGIDRVLSTYKSELTALDNYNL